MSGESPWAARAAALYDSAYARRYRAHDDEFEASGPCRDFAEWLGRVCARFAPPIDVLDLGCGTGRYFWALSGVRHLVGLDASSAMLAEARVPYNGDRINTLSLTLVQGDLMTYRFDPHRFDLVYSVGVLAEHVPLTDLLVARVVEWIKPGGRFAFTTVHPASASIPRTLARRIGEWIEPVTFGPARRTLRRRLLAGGLYADEERVRALLDRRFTIESLERMQSEAHLHCLCVARKVSP
jgi:SAM-dependent methyltransferase